MVAKPGVGALRDKIRSASEGLLDLKAKRREEEVSNGVNSRSRGHTKAENKGEGTQRGILSQISYAPPPYQRMFDLGRDE